MNELQTPQLNELQEALSAALAETTAPPEAQLYAAIGYVQRHVKIGHDGKVDQTQNGNQRGAKYSYATLPHLLEKILPVAQSLGLTLTWTCQTLASVPGDAGVVQIGERRNNTTGEIVPEFGRPWLGVVTCRVTHISGAFTTAEMPVQHNNPGAQQIAGAITLARRYTLLMALGLSTDADLDEDGNMAAASQPAPAGRGAPAFSPPAAPPAAAAAAPSASTVPSVAPVKAVIDHLREAAAKAGVVLRAEHDTPDIDREEARTVMVAIRAGTYIGLTAPKGA